MAAAAREAEVAQRRDVTLVVLRRAFGYEELRPGQAEAIDAVLDHRDCFILMATGSGKSLCYQLPPLVCREMGISTAMCLVVTPLISLMDDQVHALHARMKLNKATGRVDATGICEPACFLGSAQMDSSIEARAKRGEFALVYLTPEKLDSWMSNGTITNMVQSGVVVTHVAVDESHCLSEWGFDFRPTYRRLCALRQSLPPQVPIMALTATATPRVQEDICKSLELKSNMFRFQTSFNRPNLRYRFVTKRGKDLDLGDIARLVRDSPGNSSTIVYTLTKNLVDELVQRFRGQGLRAVGYHGGMDDAARKQAHLDFINDKAQVIVGTIAFGMGIDKPDIRQVIHYGMPKTIEAYYQQTGRAGRDGQTSTCVCIWSRADEEVHSRMLEPTLANAAEALHDMSVFAGDNETCRRKRVLEYFGEKTLGNSCETIGGEPCDVCIARQTGRTNTRDFAPEARLVLQALQDCQESVAGVALSDWLLRKPNDKLARLHPERFESYGKGRDRSADFWKRHIKLFEDKGLIQRRKVGAGFAHVLEISSRGRTFLLQSTAAEEKLVWVVPDALVGTQLAAPRTGGGGGTGASSGSGGTAPSLAEQHVLEGTPLELFEVLKVLRKRLASEKGVAPYMVFHDDSLNEMCRRLPRSAPAFLQIRGCGDLKLKDYGDVFMQEIQSFCALHPGIEALVDAGVAAPAASMAASGTRPAADSFGLKGSSARVSMDLFMQGKTLAEIIEFRAQQKSLAAGTIGGHLAECWDQGIGTDWDWNLEARFGITAAQEEIATNALLLLARPVREIETKEVVKNLLMTIPPEHVGLARKEDWWLVASIVRSKLIHSPRVQSVPELPPRTPQARTPPHTETPTTMSAQSIPESFSHPAVPDTPPQEDLPPVKMHVSARVLESSRAADGEAFPALEARVQAKIREMLGAAGRAGMTEEDLLGSCFALGGQDLCEQIKNAAHDALNRLKEGFEVAVGSNGRLMSF